MELTGRKIKKIYNTCYGSSGPTAILKVEHENGIQTIYKKHNTRSDVSEQTREIPEGHQIVGIYCHRTNNSSCHMLYPGFIVSKF